MSIKYKGLDYEMDYVIFSSTLNSHSFTCMHRVFIFLFFFNLKLSLWIILHDCLRKVVSSL